MCKLQIGSTLIELLLYIVLVGLVGNLAFGFATNLKKFQQLLWGRFNQVNVLQTTGALLAKDLSQSYDVAINPNQINCNTMHGPVIWKLRNRTILRTDQRSNLKRSTTGVVAEEVQILKVKSKSNPNSAGKLVRFKIVSCDQKTTIKQVVMLRSSLKL